jgi:protocatechuate 3,4-dioxygenase beta subunit
MSTRMSDLDPPLDSPAYRSTARRAPAAAPVRVPPGRLERAGHVLGTGSVAPGDVDLTRSPAGEAQGQRIVVAGRLLDGAGRPVSGALVEIWQANAAGR